MRTFLSIALSLLAAGAVEAAQLAIQTARVSVSGVDGGQLLSEQIPLKKALSEPVTLGPKDTFKLTFQVIESESEQGVQPHQTFLRFYDETTGEEGIQPLKVNSNGKAKFELNMARPPSSLPPSTDVPLKVSLLLGSFTHDPAKLDLFDLVVPPSAPVPEHPEAEHFRLRTEIHHTFRPDPKVPPAIVSHVFTYVVLAPWIVLIGLWTIIRPAAPRLFSLEIIWFIATLLSMELLLLRYWLGLLLGQVLFFGAVAAVPLYFSGKAALSSIAAHRLGQK